MPIALVLQVFLYGTSPSLAQSMAPIPHVAVQGADLYRFRVGAVNVIALSDGTVPQDLHALLTNTTQAKTDALLEVNFLRNPIEASINVFLIALPDRLVLVDTGSGELFGPGNGGKLLSSLAAAGYRPEQITDILITHVHTDHSGGLVEGQRIVFANATVHVGKPDVDFFLNPANSAESGYDRKYFDEAIKTLKPYVDAGKVAAFSSSTDVVPGISSSSKGNIVDFQSASAPRLKGCFLLRRSSRRWR
jgi:glyoxylase-like metal-dependent hydrolase (beta-lactamase superfamily II)